MDVRDPTKMEIRIALIFFFNLSISTYRGMARLTVAGVNK